MIPSQRLVDQIKKNCNASENYYIWYKINLAVEKARKYITYSSITFEAQ